MALPRGAHFTIYVKEQEYSSKLEDELKKAGYSRKAIFLAGAEYLRAKILSKPVDLSSSTE